MKAFRLALASCAALTLTACPGPLPGLPPAPSEVADRTKIDEQAALTITLAYTAAARAAAVGIEAGLITDRQAIARIGDLDRRAYAAVQATERAYRSGNADSYAAALVEARAAISLFLSSVKG